jgi:hypothetical protein
MRWIILENVENQEAATRKVEQSRRLTRRTGKSAAVGRDERVDEAELVAWRESSARRGAGRARTVDARERREELLRRRCGVAGLLGFAGAERLEEVLVAFVGRAAPAATPVSAADSNQ